MTEVLCQLCGAKNPQKLEQCTRCGGKLMVLSGVAEEEIEPTDEYLLQVQEDLEEHILERITTLEDGVRQLSQALESTAAHLGQLERNLTVAYAGVQAIGGLLEAQGVVSRAELVDGWERAAGQELLSRDLGRRFKEREQRILSQAIHAGEASDEFRRRLRAVELAILDPQADMTRDLLTELARMAPHNDELWSFIGEAAFETGDLESARVAFGQVLKLRGPRYETLLYAGTVASDLGRWDEAESLLREARDLSPEEFLPHFTLGALAAVRRKHRQAVDHLEAAVERQELPQGLYLLGTSYLQLGSSGRAIAALRRSLELEPRFEEALYQLGLAYLRRGWTRLAMDTFQQLQRLDPQRLQYQETVRLLRLKPPVDLPQTAARLVSRAEAALERGRSEEALSLFASAVDAAPDQASVHATAALLASALGRTRQAVGHAHWLLRQGLQDSPYLAAAVVALLESLRQAGRLRSAQRIANRLRHHTPDSLARGMAVYELALVESELGEDLVGARELAREALELTPRELRQFPLAALGTIAIKRGRFREAQQYLEQAAAMTADPPLLRQLAVARLGVGDAEGAEEALAAADSSRAVGLDAELLGQMRRLGSMLESLGPRGRPSRNGQRGG